MHQKVAGSISGEPFETESDSLNLFALEPAESEHAVLHDIWKQLNHIITYPIIDANVAAHGLKYMRKGRKKNT